MDNKFGEPWIKKYHELYDKDGNEICSSRMFYILDRISDCVGACAGMANPEVEIAEKDAEIARLKRIHEKQREANFAIHNLAEMGMILFANKLDNVMRYIGGQESPEIKFHKSEIARLKSELDKTICEFNETNKNYADLIIECAEQRGEIARLKEKRATIQKTEDCGFCIGDCGKRETRAICGITNESIYDMNKCPEEEAGDD